MFINDPSLEVIWNYDRINCTTKNQNKTESIWL